MPTLAIYLTQIVLEVLARVIRQEKKVKDNQIGKKKKLKLSLFADVENPKDSTKKLPELINGFSTIAGYKINTQKSATFLYTNNEKQRKQYHSQ